MTCAICKKEAEQFIEVSYRDASELLCGWDCLILFALKSNREWQHNILEKILDGADRASRVIRMAAVSENAQNAVIADASLDEIVKLVERLKVGSAAE